MLASRLCRAPVFQRSLVNQLPPRAVARTYANESRDALAREARRRATLKERAMAPSSGTGKVFHVNLVGLIC